MSTIQRDHLLRVGFATRFQKGCIGPNRKPEWIGLPRNAHRQPLNPCPDCGKLKLATSARCKRCCDIAKQYTHERKGVGGYMYGPERIVRPNGHTRAKPIHIQKAEQALGRPLKRNEHVHHINCNRADHRNSNLLICSSNYHLWLHGQYAKHFALLHLTQ